MEKIEHKRRVEVVASIIVASGIGLILNLLANTYYDIFITRTVKWSEINQTQIYYSLLILVGLYGLLSFFIFDYKNDLEVNKGLWKRFMNYFFYNYPPGRIMGIIVGIYILLTLVGILLILYMAMAQVSGYLMATLVMGSSLVASFIKHKRQEQIKKL